MAVSGFPIKASSIGTRVKLEPWLQSVRGTYTAVIDLAGKAKLTVSDSSAVSVGDDIWITDASQVDKFGIVTDIPDGTSITTDITFVADQSGTFAIVENSEFEDTPAGLLREAHVQFDTSGITTVNMEITFDGINYMLLNNAQTLVGLATFTFFVVKDSKLNFRIATGSTATSIVMGIVVTAA